MRYESIQNIYRLKISNQAKFDLFIYNPNPVSKTFVVMEKSCSFEQ